MPSIHHFDCDPWCDLCCVFFPPLLSCYVCFFWGDTCCFYVCVDWWCFALYIHHILLFCGVSDSVGFAGCGFGVKLLPSGTVWCFKWRWGRLHSCGVALNSSPLVTTIAGGVLCIRIPQQWIHWGQTQGHSSQSEAHSYIYNAFISTVESWSHPIAIGRAATLGHGDGGLHGQENVLTHLAVHGHIDDLW